MLSRDEILEWARRYVKAYEEPDPRLGRDQLSPYIAGLMPGSESLSPEDVWEVILAVLSMRPSDEVISVLAAGPLEDLIESEGDVFIERIETEARKNPAFRQLLGGVWRSGTPEIWARVEKARAGTV
jgi:hypothetical protein